MNSHIYKKLSSNKPNIRQGMLVYKNIENLKIMLKRNQLL